MGSVVLSAARQAQEGALEIQVPGNVGMRSGRSRWGWPLFLAALATGTVGCGSRSTAPTAPTQPFRGLTVTVGAVGYGDRGILETVAAQRGEWAASQGAQVVIRGPVDPGSLQGVDVLVFAGDRLGDLVDAGALAVLPEALVLPPAPKEPDEAAAEPAEPGPGDAGRSADPDPLRFADIAPAFRDQVARYGNDRMAFPYGGTALVLVYDRAAFDRAANRAAAEKESLALRPPRTWEQLDALARFFQGRDWDGDGAADHGIVLALGPDAEFLGDAIFLARAASLGQHRDQYSFLFNADTMAPRIDSPPFVAALEALAALKASGPPGMARLRCRGRAPGLSRGEGRAPDRPRRDGRALEPRQDVDRRRSLARLGARVRPRAQAVGGRQAGQRPELPALRRRLARRRQPRGRGQATRRRDRLRQVPDQPRHRPAGALPTAPSRCSRSDPRCWVRDPPTPALRWASMRGNGPTRSIRP